MAGVREGLLYKPQENSKGKFRLLVYNEKDPVSAKRPLEIVPLLAVSYPRVSQHPSGNAGGEAFEVRTNGARQVAAFSPASSRVARGEGA